MRPSTTRRRLLRGSVAALALLLLVAACAEAGRPDPTGSSATAPVGAAGPKAARPSDRHPAPSGRPCSAVVSGRYQVAGRSYLLSVPARDGAPAQLVVDLHGYQQDAAAQERYTGFAAYAAGRGVTVATPEGQSGGVWNFPRSPALGDDVAFLRQVVADAGRWLCGAGRVGAVGWSDGADMAATVGCAGIAAAVAGVAMSVFPSGPCPSPPPVLEIHGTADPFVPYAGGGGSRSGAFTGTEAQAVESRLARWAADAGCAEPPRTAPVAADVQRLTWGRCAVLYRVSGGGHTWPGHVGPPPVAGLGATTGSIDANRLIVDFLQERLG